MFMTSVSTNAVRAQVVHGEHDRAEAADLVLGRHRTALPRRGRPRAAVVDQHQALAFAVLERQGQPAVDLDHIAGHAAGLPSGDRARTQASFRRRRAGRCAKSSWFRAARARPENRRR